MKRFLMMLLASWSIPAAFAQPSSNYFAIVSSNTYIHGVSKQFFTVGNATYTDATNVPIFGIGGYLYPSNFVGTTKWSFPPRIIVDTNALISFNVLTTNSGTTVAGTYRIMIYTNNIAAPMYNSGAVSWFGVVAPYNTNLQIVNVTNVLPVGVLNNTNIVLSTFEVKIGPIVGNWYASWITGGEIHF